MSGTILSPDQLIREITFERLAPALENLFRQIDSYRLRSEMLEVTRQFMAECLETGKFPANPSLAFVTIPNIIAIQHLTWGKPLFFSSALATAWLAQGTAEALECPRDGYFTPRSFSACPICGSRTASRVSFQSVGRRRRSGTETEF